MSDLLEKTHPDNSSKKIVCRIEDTDCDDLDLKLSRLWLRIAIAGVFAGQGMVFSLALNMTPPPFGSMPYWILHGGLIFSSLVVMAFLGGPLFASTWGMLRSRRLSIEGLFTLSLVGAFVGSLAGSLTGEGDVFYEIVSIVIAIYTFGRMLGERSQARLMAESEELRERFDQVQRVDGDTGPKIVPLSEVDVGDLVRVDPGGPIAVDGIVREGVGYVKETALTGEPLPVVRSVGDRVRAGTFSEDGSFLVEVEAGAGARELDQILNIVQSTDGEPSELQLQANRLIQYFLPLVAAVAILSALLWAAFGTWMEAVFNSMAVLLVACPCALGLATPVAIWQGLYRMAQKGLISRDGAFVDAMADVQTVYFDKTGTLSEREMRVVETLVSDLWQERRTGLMRAVSSLESRSSHPIAQTLIKELGVDESDFPIVRDWRLIPAKGVAGKIELEGSEVELRVGEIVDPESCSRAVELETRLRFREGKRVYVSIDTELAAIFVLQERPRAGLEIALEELKALGVQAQVLTGDPNPNLQLPAHVHLQAGLSAADKAKIIELAAERGENPCFVGDGINDVIAMSAANTSISMESGTGLANSAGVAQLRYDRVQAIPEAIALARRIRARLRGNLFYAASYNFIGMSLAAFGLLHPVAAASIMLISSFFVTFRALRLN
ncbi:MAG: heavy metal translocating P-type ATPase [Verrucomicrobiota bacterium]